MPPAAGKKRSLDGPAEGPKTKKTKVSSNALKQDKPPQTSSNLVQDEVDFPRGGGTSFTPLEVKAIRAEAVKEADAELFQDKEEQKSKKRKRKSESIGTEKNSGKAGKGDTIRIEHLNYKRIAVGMKIFAQILAVHPLVLIVSLPNQLLGHVPITHVSSELTTRLESMDEDAAMSSEEEDDGEDGDDDDEASSAEANTKSRIPELPELFQPGQYVRGIVTAIHAQGTSSSLGMSLPRDDTYKGCQRVELSLSPDKVNDGVSKSDLKKGFTLSASVKSVEDHGYVLNLGIPDVSGFLPFKSNSKHSSEVGKLQIGQLLNLTVSKMSGNGRICTMAIDSSTFSSSSISEVSTVASVLPGTLVHSLVTAVVPNGLNLQVLGFFQGTIDQFHLRPGSVEENYKVGQKLKARVLYDISPSTPPRFALSMADHITSLTDKRSTGSNDEGTTSLSDSYPIGTILDAVEIVRVEGERGLTAKVSPSVEGFVHISHASDEHVPSLSSSSGPWKLGTYHRARVIGYYPLDGLLQLSLKHSVLEQKFLQVGEVNVGEVIKGTIKRLTDTALFVSISGNVDAVVWPNHYSDIRLKHPQKRFKPGGSLKCRTLVVDPSRKRVVLTAKKSLIESTLPIISKLEDAEVGLITHATVFKVSEKNLQVEFYNNLKAIVPAREISETAIASLADTFPVGKVVKVRIISAETETGRIVASIRQASPNFKSAIMDVTDVEIGNTVEGVISEIQKDKLLLTLQPTQVRALLSLNNLANRRGIPLAQLRASLKSGDKLQELVVTTRNPEKGFVLVATKPKDRPPKEQQSLGIGTIQVGQHVHGRVIRHIRQGALVKITSHISGILHPTHTCDDYEAGRPFPPDGTHVEASVVAIDEEKKQLTLSTRPSRLDPDQAPAVTDKEINTLDDLPVGSTVRGFVKSVAEHGLFVMLGQGIDGRVQIKELFDDFVKDWKGRFSANQLVKGRVLNVDSAKKQVELSFRSPQSSKEKAAGLQLSDLHEGEKVDGVVKKIEDYGLFIEIAGSKIRGLCHKSELSDNKEADITLALRSFREGDRVKVVILSVDVEKRRVSLGLKPSYFEEEDFTSESEGGDEDSDAEPETLGVVLDDDHADEGSSEVASEEDNEDNVDMDDVPAHVDLNLRLDKNTSKLTPSAAGNRQPTLTLKLGHGFQWSAEDHQDDENSGESSEEDNDDEQGGRKKKRKKQIEQDLTADMHNKMPESNADFERLLLGSPNSSYLWIQYMSFQLQLSEIEKAREIAKRALKTISFREEGEKLNVWIALLNLENVYGTDESLESTLKDAARHNDSNSVHLRMAAIFDQSEKFEKAEELYQKTCKKFGQSSKVWTLFGEHYLRRGQLEQARSLLPRCLQSLEKRKHLKTISKFAQLEYKLGDPERGKTIFEGIIDSHPKRWDLWSIYVDMEAGQNDIASVRNLFDRVLALKMTSHKAKSFFKKWLGLERSLGDEEGAEVVKAKAVEWTKRAAT